MSEARDILSTRPPHRVGRPASLLRATAGIPGAALKPSGRACPGAAPLLGETQQVTAIFADALRIRAGHTLSEVSRQPRASQSGNEIWEWEHEEYDEVGLLVAVYESWIRGQVPAGAHSVICLVKHSPCGWVLQQAGALSQ